MTPFSKSILLLLLFSKLVLYAQIQEQTPPDYIKTITFKGDTQVSQLPVILMGSPVTLEFDALNGDEADFYYKIEHFDFDWTPSRLMKTEFMRGFDNQRIRDYLNSFNTYQIYSHYVLQIPNEQTRALTKSGNYLISIYNSYDELMFSKKFMIYEDLVNVGIEIKRSRDVSTINEKQSVDFKIDSGSLTLTNPNETVKTLVVQNNNLNTAITNLKPQYTLGSQLIYKYPKASSFWAGNEYLYFENKDVRGANVGVQFIELLDIYNNFLFINTPRYNTSYTYNPDINGNFLITALDTDDVRIEADYTVLHFALQHPKLKEGQHIYIYGNYNSFNLDESNRMWFNEDKQLYECSLTLKQGFYNYKYVVVDENNNLQEGAISGNFYQTENTYNVYVYYRNLGGRYDRLIGKGEASSINISN
ncbi:MAG: DUF5103 domain-containing protein [Bacteroidetes bacterium MedPE-SWsnd-G2]|nr:MAG: DUF5103 domain-containing protein [Bacteroidetes bacterium MedPE-SWsnd-G2]